MTGLSKLRLEQVGIIDKTRHWQHGRPRLDPPWEEYEKGSIGVAIGAFDDPYPYTPTFHYGIVHKLSWVANNDGIPGERIDTDEELRAVYIAPNSSTD